MNIFTCIDDGRGPRYRYGKAVRKGEQPIVYDPLTEEGYKAIADTWGVEEAEQARLDATSL